MRQASNGFGTVLVFAVGASLVMGLGLLWCFLGGTAKHSVDRPVLSSAPDLREELCKAKQLQDQEDDSKRSLAARSTERVAAEPVPRTPSDTDGEPAAATVMDRWTGEPVTLFLVRITRGSSDSETDLQWVRIRDDRGRLALDPLGSGVVQLLVQAPGYRPYAVEVPCTPRESPLKIFLDRGASVGGQAVAATGCPLAEARVHLWKADAAPDSAPTAVTDTDDHGRFELSNLAAGSYRISLAHYSTLGDTEFRVEDGDRVERTLQAEVDNTLHVNVSDGQGLPFPRARVLVRIHKTQWSGLSSAHGRASLHNLPAGTHAIEVHAPGHSLLRANLEVPRYGEVHKSLELQP